MSIVDLLGSFSVYDLILIRYGAPQLVVSPVLVFVLNFYYLLLIRLKIFVYYLPSLVRTVVLEFSNALCGVSGNNAPYMTKSLSSMNE